MKTVEIVTSFRIEISQISDVSKKIFKKIKEKNNQSLNINDELFNVIEDLIDFSQAITITEIDNIYIEKFNGK